MVKQVEVNKKRNFKTPQQEAKIYELSYKKFAEQSCKKIKWAVGMYDEWRLNRMKEIYCPQEIVKCDLSLISEFSQTDLSFALSRFITEIKKLDNTDYPPNTLREIIVMVQMHLHQNGMYWKLLDGNNFQTLRNVLDNTMKERTAKGLGVRRSSEVISLSQEDKMFQCGALGDSNPEQLLRTVIYMLGLHLALRGGVEHHKLRRPGFSSQITTEIEESSGREMIVYKEDPLQKTNQGGLGCRNDTKIVKVFTSSNVQRCPVRILSKYLGLLPQSKSCGKLYLRPKKKPFPSVWYCDQPYGKNRIASNVKELCRMANISGKYTNHSLRATSASQMYQCNIPEQVIKEITGHRSECVRTYKKTNVNLLKEASATIAGGECSKNDDKVVKTEAKKHGCEYSPEQKERLDQSLNACQIIKNVVKTRMEIRNKEKLMKKGVSKVARRIVKSQKKKICEKFRKSSGNKHMVLDINLNLNVKK